jgi:hypothetical protein
VKPRSEGALCAGLPIICTAAWLPVDGLCACGTALSKDRLSLSRRPSGLVGRVPESGHTAGEPIVAEQDLDQATAAARALAERLRSWICPVAVSLGNPPPGATAGVWQ